MKSKINIIFPIALAVILPGLALYSNSEWVGLSRYQFFGSWPIASILLYIFWYLLWFLWDAKTPAQKWRLVAALVVFFGFIGVLLYQFLFPNIEHFRWIFIFRITLATFLFLGIQFALKTQQNLSRLQIEKEQIQTENYRAQLKSLRAKIDPHFLFNSLNTLRSMVRQGHSNSEQFIMSLSDFYRQTLKYDENTTLPLLEELEVLESFLFLMKNRNEEAVNVNISIDASVYQSHLPTLALQVVVENCFKHNSMTSKMPLHIEISNTPDFYIKVSNNIQPKIGDQGASGYGLELLRKRYTLLNIQQGLIVEQTADQFSVKLKLI